MKTKRYSDRYTSRNTKRLHKTIVKHPACKTWRQKGSHRIYKGPKGSVPMPYPGELSKGLWCALIKQLIAIGLGLMALVPFVAVLLGVA